MSVRSEVLSAFKLIHRTCRQVFAEDVHALAVARTKVNEEFRKNKNLTDTEIIKQFIRDGLEAQQYLQSCVVQLRHNNQKGVYVARTRVNEEFRKNMNLTDISIIRVYIMAGLNVTHFMRHCVVQTELDQKGVYGYEMKFPEYTAMTDDNTYSDDQHHCPDCSSKK